MRKKLAKQGFKQRKQTAAASTYESIKDLIGAIDDELPSDLSARKKHYLGKMGYGRKRPREITTHAKEVGKTKA